MLLTQEDHVTSAPRATKVSMRTAVWMVLTWCKHRVDLVENDTYIWRQPAMRAPERGFVAAYFHFKDQPSDESDLDDHHLFPKIHEARHLILKNK